MCVDTFISKSQMDCSLAPMQVYPATRHDGTALEAHRLVKCGQPLAEGLKGALVEMRADLLEFVTACGFVNWRDIDRPCFLCNAPKSDMFNFPPSMDACHWVMMDKKAYQETVEELIVRRRIDTPESLQDLLKHCHFSSKYGGRSIVQDYPPLALTAGMRLMEAGRVFDLADEALTSLALPLDLVFSMHLQIPV